MVELGLWFVDSSVPVPTEAKWVIANTPEYVAPRADLLCILNWVDAHPPGTLFRTAVELNLVESQFRILDTTRFWGVLFINEEQYRREIQFEANVDTTWFGERLLGYPLYLQENPAATINDWQDEMYLRMIRGFYNYFSPLTKVGITWGVTNPETWNESYGEPATAFIREHYDFLFLYPYTANLDEWLRRSKPYLSAVETLFPNQKKFWILTRIWDYNRAYWQREAIALEMKNCLDRNMPMLAYYYAFGAPYSFEQTWSDILKCIVFYDTNQPYYESLVYGRNLLTDATGITYGWLIMMGDDWGPNLLKNPSFESGIDDWILGTPEGAAPLITEIRPGIVGSYVAMISDIDGYHGGLFQRFLDVSPNTIMRLRAKIKTTDAGALEAHVCYVDVFGTEGKWYGGKAAIINGTKDWQLYEYAFTTPNVPTRIHAFPALVFNRGTVEVDETELSIFTPTPISPIIDWWNHRSPLEKAVIIGSVPLSIIGIYIYVKRRG